MPTVENLPSDFELLTHFVRELRRFSYRELQDTIRKVQVRSKIFQKYFNNIGDIEGVNPPESMQLSFHFKVLYHLGYIKRTGTEYVASRKLEEEDEGKNPDSKAVREILSSVLQH